jgi:hypothetical protein
MRLEIFDFDNTLFKSPHPPKDWKGGWWGKPLSLSEPHVPANPGLDWWNSKVLAAAQRAVRDPNCWAVLCTGRIERVFRPRVAALLRSQGLHFDESFFNTGGATEDFKKRVISKYLDEDPWDSVVIWEDRANHLAQFKSLVQSYGVPVTAHLVHDDSVVPA